MLALDLRTIFLIASTINIVLCCALAMYWRTQKTFPGFGIWVLANICLALVYVLYMLRGVAPDFWSIVIANTLASGAAVLRLEGTRRFLGYDRILRLSLTTPLLAFLLIAYFTYAQDSAAARITVVAVTVALPVVVAGQLLMTQPAQETRGLYRSIAALLFLQGGILLYRAVVWIFWPENRNLFTATPINVGYFFFQIVAEILLAMAYLTLTSQRLARELRAAEQQRAASETAERQQRTLAEALVDSAAALSSTLDQEQVLARILENVGRVVRHDAADVMLLEPGQQAIHIARSSGYQAFGGDGMTVLQTLHLDVNTAPNLAQAIATRQPVLLADVTQEPRWVSVQATRWIRANLTAPILLKGEVVGFLTVNSATPAFFTTADAERLCIFADQAAIAIGNARLYAAEQRNAGALAASNQELDAFAHTVAHDLRNPLGIILGFAELLCDAETVIDAHDTQKLLTTIVQNGRKMNSIIEELLALSALRTTSTLEMTTLDMAIIVAEVQARLVDMIIEYQAEIETPATWPDVYGHAPWVEEVWFNLLSNAIKYGGQPLQIRLGATMRPDSQVAFWVCDNGYGIPPAQHDRLFTPHQRLAQTQHIEGMGLGLSIVKRIVARMGGEVGVESNGVPGQGSTFYFTLPAAKESG